MCINRSFRSWILAAVCLAAGQLFALESRIWADGTDKQVEATYSRELLGGVLVRDARSDSILIHFEDLTLADLNYLKYRVPPVVEVDTDYTTRQLGRTEWSREDDDTILYTFNISIEKKSRLPYVGELTAELFVLGRERLVADDNQLVLMNYSRTVFTLPDEKRSQYEFSVPDISFNAYRASWILVPSAVERGKTYCGVIVAISDAKGNLIASECDFKLDWVTDNLSYSIESLRRFYKEHPGSIESRHFNSKFEKLEPPRIPWFQRFPSD